MAATRGPKAGGPGNPKTQDDRGIGLQDPRYHEPIVPETDRLKRSLSESVDEEADIDEEEEDDESLRERAE